jgi:hypothetical protein
MHRAIRCFTIVIVIVAFWFVATAFRSQAQTLPVPPIKPGLWEFQNEREVNGQKMPDMNDRLKNMSPEKRAQIEAMMKQRGIGMGAGNTGQLCYTRESIEHSPWADQQSDCKTDFSTRSSSAWKWHSSCPKFGSESDGEAIFTDSEHYTVKSTTVTKLGDKSRTSTNTITAKRVSADCGDVKPLDLRH